MGEIHFYHLTRGPLEVALPKLLEKSLAAGWRVLVQTGNQDRLEWLDQKLWLGADDAFLPHGQVGGVHDADQPILISSENKNINSAKCFMCVDGAHPDAKDADAYERVCYLFDGHDSTSVDDARKAWKALTDTNVKAKYWSEESGKWEMKAQS